jgi:AraC family transcriptional regulator, alkane utilization regulator
MEPLNPNNSEDTLNDAFSHLHIRGTVYCRSELRAPWAFSVEKRAGAGFHAVVQGQGWLEIEGEDGKIAVSAGDFILLPHGDGHVMRGSAATQPTQLDELIAQNPLVDGILLKMNGRGAATVLICGGFELEGRSTNPLLANLPKVIRLRGNSGQAIPLLQATLRQIDIETRSGLAGSQALISKLSDVLFIQAVRAYFHELAGDGRGHGWVAALKNPKVGAAIALIHRHPQADWGVASLASKVGMSRSGFSAKFRELVGEPPLKYVAKWRVHRAAWHLRTSDAKLSEIAERVGYESGIALGRAFKRFTGMTPGSYRRRNGSKP